MLNAANAAFAETLANAGIKTRAATPNYLVDQRGNHEGIGEVVALPASTEEVARIVKLCAEARVGIVPYGGGTGLVVGHIAPNGPTPLILSMEKMTAIRAVFPEEYTLIAEAGVILSDLHTAAEQANRLFPLTYGSKDSARIGGGLAVNSGGLNVLRYGTARDLCLGIEAVLPNGEILHGLKRLRKDNTGYDLRNLLIGAEGTLGIITAAALKLHPRPANTATAFLTTPSPVAALSLLSLFAAQTDNTVSGFELIPAESYLFLEETFPDLHLPFETPPDWSVLVELGTGPATDAQALLTDIFELALAQGLTADGQIAQSAQQRDAFWAIRETIPLANRRIGAIASHDIALPLGVVDGFMTEAKAAIEALLPDCRINAFGHLGDGNLHYNVFPPNGQKRDAYMHHSKEITRVVFDLTLAQGGTFSAEHGIGRLKAGELANRGDPAKLDAMRAIKTALDPLGIMNPGAVLG
ncbi:MAG: FAD-binding oxidoreductase [Pseudomonadota bacterium]